MDVVEYGMNVPHLMNTYQISLIEALPYAAALVITGMFIIGRRKHKERKKQQEIEQKKVEVSNNNRVISSNSRVTVNNNGKPQNVYINKGSIGKINNR